jgi:hypothetical protein
MRRVRPACERLALASWRCRARKLLAGRAPFVLCLARDALREGARLLIAEWMEYRRRAPGNPWSLVVRTGPSDGASRFGFVSPFWEQVQALKRQLGVRRAGVYLWDGDADAGTGPLVDAAAAVVALAPAGAGTVRRALEQGKPVLVPRPSPLAEGLPEGYPYTFAARPAALRFLEAARRTGDAPTTWDVPEPLALARALERLTASSR